MPSFTDKILGLSRKQTFDLDIKEKAKFLRNIRTDYKVDLRKPFTKKERKRTNRLFNDYRKARYAGASRIIKPAKKNRSAYAKISGQTRNYKIYFTPLLDNDQKIVVRKGQIFLQTPDFNIEIVTWNWSKIRDNPESVRDLLRGKDFDLIQLIVGGNEFSGQFTRINQLIDFLKNEIDVFDKYRINKSDTKLFFRGLRLLRLKKKQKNKRASISKIQREIKELRQKTGLKL